MRTDNRQCTDDTSIVRKDYVRAIAPVRENIDYNASSLRMGDNDGTGRRFEDIYSVGRANHQMG